MRGFQEDWSLPRKLALTYTLPSDTTPLVACEGAFHMLNAPTELLNEYEQNIIAGYKGHSLSVGDVVEVDGVKYLCASMGWQKQGENK